MGMSRLASMSLTNAMASCTLGLVTMISHTQVGSPSATHTHLWPACTSGRAYSTSGWPCHVSRYPVCCSTPVTAALTLYSASCLRGVRATGGRTGMPALAIRCSSTRSTPHTSRLVSRTGPPPMRQLTSMRRAPRLVALSSTWNTPRVSPSACTLRTASSHSSACVARGSIDGQLEPVSLKYGSTVGQLSVTAPYTGTPPSSTRSTSTSCPSRYSSSMSTSAIHSPALPPAPSSSSGSPSVMAPATMRAFFMSATTRAYAACSSSSLFTRMTPMDAAPLTGLMTAGYPTCAPAGATSVGFSMR
mmetsp:Transcript_20023/g.50804  ORF Transcript_20023/g.50804 Transcript_20023/m.50804 type:complete len:303 (-) Transcript_20023:1029-1937(-)